MLQIGFTELVVFAAIAFLLFGPDRIAGLAKQAIQTVRDLRSHVDEMADAVGRPTWEPPRNRPTDEVSVVPLAALFGAGLAVLLVAAFWALQVL